VGLKRKGVLPRCGGVGRLDLGTGTGPLHSRVLSPRREQAERARVASNYWSSTTNANNPNNAWNVNFNNGNVNNNNKTNNNFVTAIRGGS